MYTKDAAFRPGQSITIEVSNKPYLDRTIPPEANDYRWATAATIQIYDPEDALVIFSGMVEITERVGWYSYRYQTTEDNIMGQYRVVIRMHTSVTEPVPPPITGGPESVPTNTTQTSGTSGSPSDLVDVQVSYFNIVDLY